jgi:hypothetical protein
VKLRDLIKQALDGDPSAAGKVAEYCRFRLLMDYADTLSFVQSCAKRNGWTVLAAPDWDALLYESDI